MDIQKKIGQRIAQLRREELELSQQKFSYEADIDKSFLSHIENGRKNISLGTLTKIINALGVSWKEFFNSNEFGKNEKDIELH